MIEVVRPGLLSTVQDLGRPGYAHLGVGRSGALDAPSLIRANRLAGNQDGAAGIETTLTGVTLRAEVDTVAVVCGAVAPLHVDGEPVPFDTPFPVPAGAVIDIGAAADGVRSYVAFAGGVTVAPVLGSRSTDTLSGLGPPPLRAGFVLPIGRTAPPRIPDEPAPMPAAAATSSQAAPVAAQPSSEGRSSSRSQGRFAGSLAPGSPDPSAEPAGGGASSQPAGVLRLRLRLGPRHDWLSVPGRDALGEAAFALSVKSNRVGARLTGPILTRAVTTELPSEGIVLGAVQVPADGQPLIFLADHPTTGGYPVVGVVDPADVAALSQARPGTTIRFVTWT